MSARPLADVPYVTDVFGAFDLPTPNLRVYRDEQDVTDAFLREHPDRATTFKALQDALPGNIAESLLTETERTRRASVRIDRSLVPQYNSAIAVYEATPAHIRDRLLRRFASVLAFTGMKYGEPLAASCLARGTSWRAVLQDDMDLGGNNIANVMPTLDALVILTMGLIRRGRKVTRNDVQDAGHLANAVPYADIVMTDRDMAALYALSGLAEKARATVHFALDALLDELAARH